MALFCSRAPGFRLWWGGLPRQDHPPPRVSHEAPQHHPPYSMAAFLPHLCCLIIFSFAAFSQVFWTTLLAVIFDVSVIPLCWNHHHQLFCLLPPCSQMEGLKLERRFVWASLAIILRHGSLHGAVSNSLKKTVWFNFYDAGSKTWIKTL